MEAKLQRQQAMTDSRRALVLDAARAVFKASGIEGASIREIAKRAGYTPGAIYSYFDNKEAIYGALLAESLELLNAQVLAANTDPAPARRLRATALAWFGFYADNPHDLDLGFYLFQGLQPRGLTSELNTRLNGRLLDALAPCAQALADLGLDAEAARRENTALFAQGVGLLLLQHTGRIRLFGQQAPALFDHCIASLLQRLE